MKFSLPRSTILACAATLAFVPAPLVSAHDEKPAVKADQAEHAHKAAPKFPTTPDALAVVIRAANKIEKLVGSKQLAGVHAQADMLNPALRALPEIPGDLSADKKKRLESAVRQAARLVVNVRNAADAGEQTTAETELTKLVPALRLVEAQFPADVVKAAKEKAQPEG